MVVGYHHYRKHPYWEFGKNYPTGTTPTSPLFLYPTFYRFTASIRTKKSKHPPTPKTQILESPISFWNSALFTNKQGLTRSCNACRSTVSVCTAQPSIQSTTTMAPSVIRKAAVTCGEAPVWGWKNPSFPFKKMVWKMSFLKRELVFWGETVNLET